MRELVAIDVERAADALSILRDVWDSGDAAIIVDQRLPGAAKRQLLNGIGVHSVANTRERRPLSPSSEPMLDGDALVIATSGTSGEPKGVVHTHASLRAASIATSAALGCGAEAHWLACLPLAHIGGFGVITRAWHTGARLTVLDSFDPAIVDASDATHVSLVATAMRRIDTSRFSRVLLGGSRPPSELPRNVVTTYGLTESCGGIVYNRRPIPGVEVRIAEDGEVLLRGPMLMARYRGESVPEHPVDSAGWLHTNDIGSITEGELHVQGRRGDLIVTGGEKVWPDAVEQVVAAHPDVAECAVAGVEDAEWGHIVTVWVVPQPGSAVTLDAIRGHVAQSMPRYCAPKRMITVEAIPRTALGKVARAALVATVSSNDQPND